MNTLKKSAIALASLAIVTGLASCKKDNDDINNPAVKGPQNAIVVQPSTSGEHKTAQMNMRMVDAPSAYAFQQVNVQIQSMAGLITEDDGTQTWVNLGANGSVQNAVSLVNGESAVISDATVYAGHLSQIYIQFGDDNSVVIDGQSQNLDFSGASSLTLNVDYDIEEGENFDLMLDFDVAGSIVAHQNSGGVFGGTSFTLNPTVHIFDGDETSEISGQLALATILTLHGILGGDDSSVLVVATNGVHTYSTYANANGYFMLQGVEQGGNYSVTAYFSNGFSISLGDGVDVGANLNINLGLQLTGE